MDFRLKVFSVVAKHLSFTAAARELEISQPAITRHIQELESIYSLQLFDRTGAKIKLTEKGFAFLKYARRVLDSYCNLSTEAAIMNLTFDGDLKMGVDKSLIRRVGQTLVEPFIERFAGVRITLVYDTPDSLQRNLAAGAVDLAILQSPEAMDDNLYEHIPGYGFCLVSKKNERNGDVVNFIAFAKMISDIREL